MNKISTQESFNQAVNQILTKIHDEYAGVPVDDGAFDEEEPPCDIVQTRGYLPAELLMTADADIFSEVLVKSPSYDLLTAAKMAGLDAYREYLSDRYIELYGDNNG